MGVFYIFIFRFVFDGINEWNEPSTLTEMALTVIHVDAILLCYQDLSESNGALQPVEVVIHS